MEFYGGEDWRKNEGAELKRCIQRLVEDKYVKDYQRDSEPDKEIRGPLEEKVGAKWREDQGVAGRSYILGIIKEGKRNLEDENTKEEEGNQESEKKKEEERDHGNERTKEEEKN